MKTPRKFILFLALCSMMISCEKDDDFTQVSAFENALHNEVNAYRKRQGLNELALQFIMVKEAQDHCVGRANGTISDDNAIADMNERWHTVKSKLGVNNVTNYQNIPWILFTDQSAADVVAEWAADSIGKIILEMDYTLSGPGIGKTSDGRTYIMHMLCKWTE
ncbi:CAP domain-containing protein [Bacteroidota bacterium]